MLYEKGLNNRCAASACAGAARILIEFRSASRRLLRAAIICRAPVTKNIHILNII